MTAPPPDSASHDPTSNSCVDAVEALVALRTELARLREREAELCDEIQSYATENDTTRVAGATRDAVIETRRPLRLDPARLPLEILSDPAVFTCEAEAVVLLAPHRETASQAVFESASLAHIETIEDALRLHVTADPDEASSKDLLPTQHVALQPMVGLPEEEIAAFLAPSDVEMPSVDDDEALKSAALMEAAADLLTDSPIAPKTSPLGSAFSSRRIIGTGG